MAGHNADSQNVNSHNVEVIMSKSQNVDSENVDSHNVESVTHTRFRTPGPIGMRNACHACYLSDVLVHSTCVLMEVVTNQKGRRTLLLDGFAYTVERERNGKIYWRCKNETSAMFA